MNRIGINLEDNIETFLCYNAVCLQFQFCVWFRVLPLQREVVGVEPEIIQERNPKKMWRLRAACLKSSSLEKLLLR